MGSEEVDLRRAGPREMVRGVDGGFSGDRQISWVDRGGCDREVRNRRTDGPVSRVCVCVCDGIWSVRGIYESSTWSRRL